MKKKEEIRERIGNSKMLPKYREMKLWIIKEQRKLVPKEYKNSVGTMILKELCKLLGLSHESKLCECKQEQTDHHTVKWTNLFLFNKGKSVNKKCDHPKKLMIKTEKDWEKRQTSKPCSRAVKIIIYKCNDNDPNPYSIGNNSKGYYKEIGRIDVCCYFIPNYCYRQAYDSKRQQTKGLDLNSFILNKQKLVDLEKIQALFFLLMGVRTWKGVSLFLVNWLSCV